MNKLHNAFANNEQNIMKIDKLDQDLPSKILPSIVFIFIVSCFHILYTHFLHFETPKLLENHKWYSMNEYPFE